MSACRAKMCWIAPRSGRARRRQRTTRNLKSGRKPQVWPEVLNLAGLRSRQFPHFPWQHEQMAVPPAVLGAPMLAEYRFPAHADFFEHVYGRLVVHVDRRDDPVGSQIEKRGVDQRQRNLG